MKMRSGSDVGGFVVVTDILLTPQSHRGARLLRGAEDGAEVVPASLALCLITDQGHVDSKPKR